MSNNSIAFWVATLLVVCSSVASALSISCSGGTVGSATTITSQPATINNCAVNAALSVSVPDMATSAGAGTAPLVFVLNGSTISDPNYLLLNGYTTSSAADSATRPFHATVTYNTFVSGMIGFYNQFPPGTIITVRYNNCNQLNSNTHTVNTGHYHFFGTNGLGLRGSSQLLIEYNEVVSIHAAHIQCLFIENGFTLSDSSVWSLSNNNISLTAYYTPGSCSIYGIYLFDSTKLAQALGGSAFYYSNNTLYGRSTQRAALFLSTTISQLYSTNSVFEINNNRVDAIGGNSEIYGFVIDYYGSNSVAMTATINSRISISNNDITLRTTTASGPLFGISLGQTFMTVGSELAIENNLMLMVNETVPVTGIHFKLDISLSSGNININSNRMITCSNARGLGYLQSGQQFNVASGGQFLFTRNSVEKHTSCTAPGVPPLLYGPVVASGTGVFYLCPWNRYGNTMQYKPSDYTAAMITSFAVATDVCFTPTDSRTHSLAPTPTHTPSATHLMTPSTSAPHTATRTFIATESALPTSTGTSTVTARHTPTAEETASAISTHSPSKTTSVAHTRSDPPSSTVSPRPTPSLTTTSTHPPTRSPSPTPSPPIPPTPTTSKTHNLTITPTPQIPPTPTTTGTATYNQAEHPTQSITLSAWASSRTSTATSIPKPSRTMVSSTLFSSPGCSGEAVGSTGTLLRLQAWGLLPVTLSLSSPIAVGGVCPQQVSGWSVAGAVNATVSCNGTLLTVWSIDGASISAAGGGWAELTGTVATNVSAGCAGGVADVSLSLYVDATEPPPTNKNTTIVVIPGMDVSVPGSLVPGAMGAAMPVDVIEETVARCDTDNPMELLAGRVGYRALSPLSVVFSPLGMVVGGIVVVFVVVSAQLAMGAILCGGGGWLDAVFMPGLGLHAAGATLYGVGIGGGMLVVEGGAAGALGWLAAVWVCILYPLVVVAVAKRGAAGVRYVACGGSGRSSQSLEDPLSEEAANANSKAQVGGWRRWVSAQGYIEPRDTRRRWGGMIGGYALPPGAPSWVSVAARPLVCVWVTPFVLTVTTILGSWLGCTGVFAVSCVVEAAVAAVVAVWTPHRFRVTTVCSVAMHGLISLYFVVGLASDGGDASWSSDALDGIAHVVMCVMGIRLATGTTCLVSDKCILQSTKGAQKTEDDAPPTIPPPPPTPPPSTNPTALDDNDDLL